MRYKSVIIPAICFFLVVTIVFSGCSLIDFPNYVIQHYSFDGQEGLYNPNDPDLDKQMDKFNVLIERNPEDATYYYGRALAYFEKGQYDKAMVDLNKVIELSPEYAPAYNMRGRAYYDKGEYDKAISDCNKAIEIEKDPKYIAAYYYNRGFSYYSTGEYDKAIDDYTKAIEMDSKIDSDLYRKASKLDSAYYRRGLVYKAKGEYDIAARDFEKVVQMANDPKVVAAARQALKDIGK